MLEARVVSVLWLYTAVVMVGLVTGISDRQKLKGYSGVNLIHGLTNRDTE